MSECYVGEIRMFAGQRVPRGWVLCDGSKLSISDHQPLYNLIGTTYGGDGVTNFLVPDLRGRVPVHKGQLTGGANYPIGQALGTEGVALSVATLPAHTHTLSATSAAGTSAVPSANEVLSMPATTSEYAYVGASNHPTNLNANTLGLTGASQAHENMMPTCAINFIIATDGIYPTQN